MLVRRRASATAVLAVALLAGLLALLPTPASAAPGDVSISEIHYDNAGADTGEAIEVAGPPGTSVAGLTLVLYNGNGGTTYAPLTTLAGTLPASGFLAVNVPGLQNGSPDGVALVEADGTTVAEFLSYEGQITATNGPASGMTSTDIGVAELGNEPAGLSLQKVDGAWIGPVAATFGEANVPDDPEEPEEPGVCTGDGFTHTIAEVQGPGAASPLAPGTAVKVTGVVTADHATGGYNGMTIQTAGTGGAAHAVAASTASTAVFVYFGSDPLRFPAVDIGDAVEVSGTVSEFNTVTQLTTDAVADTAVCASDQAIPAATPLPLPLPGDAREAAESMVVEPVGPFTVSDTYQSDRFGELILAAGTEPAPIPTDRFAPGTPEALAQRTANAEGRIVLDDARTTDLASAGQLPSYYGPTTPIRVGDQVADFGPVVLSYGFGQWRLQPTTPVEHATPPAERTTFAGTNPRTPAPADVGGDLTVGSFNVLNYFVHFGGEARGAANEAELLQQEEKIVSAIVALDADVLALEEIENSVRFDGGVEPQAALARLVGALNAAEGAGTWDYVESPADLPPAAAQDVITGAIIYKPASVALAGPSRSVNDETVWFNAREPIAQTFTADDATFTVVVNHFKSKSPGTPAPTGDNADAGDGQGAWNGDRVRQAQALVDFVADVQADAGSDEVLLFGDFNAYTYEDPMAVFAGADYTDLGTEFPTGRHSYVFGGEEGSLDHALASPTLLDRVTGFDIWEINAHEAFPFQYDGNPAFYDPGPYRASDHNPELVGLDTTDGDPTGPVELQLLGINDFHGRIQPTAAGPPPVGGAAQLAGLVDQLRAENPNTALVAAGDLIGASTFVSAVDDDNPTIDAMNAAGLDVSAVGNHELDQGFADLTDRVIPRAEFPYLAANIYRDGERALDAYVVQEIGGIDVGYVGVITEETPSLVSPGGIVGLEFRDPVDEAASVAAQLKDGDAANGEADVVVLLAHEGAAEATTDVADLEADDVFGRFVDLPDDVDVIFSGHTHQEYAVLGPVPGGGAADRPLVQTGDYGEKLGRVTLLVDPETGDVSQASAELLDVVGIDPVNAEVAAIVDEAVANSAVLGAEVIGSITADIRRDPARATESVAGNFIADVQLEATSEPGRGGAQIALMNPGGIRADFLYGENGEITYSEAFAVQSFSNDVFTKSFTGAELKAVLEQQWQPAGASRPVLWLGVSKGFTYTYDPDRAQGSRINAESMMLDGVPIDPAATYRITMNSFLAGGGDNFTVLGGGTNSVTTGDNDLTMLVDHFRANSPVTADPEPRTSIDRSQPIDVRITKTASSAEVQVGDTLTYQLSVDRVGAVAPTDLVVTDTVPDNFEIVSATRGWFQVPCEVAGQTVTCSLNAGPTSTFALVTVRAVTAGADVVNTATVAAAEPDPDPASNTSSATVDVVVIGSDPDLRITKTASAAEVAVGDTFEYLLFVENPGARAATGVRVADIVPAGLEVVSAKRGWFGVPCTVSGRSVVCNLGTVSTYGFVVVQVRATTAGTVVNTAGVTGDQRDPDPSSNTSTVAVEVTAPEP